MISIHYRNRWRFCFGIIAPLFALIFLWTVDYNDFDLTCDNGLCTLNKTSKLERGKWLTPAILRPDTTSAVTFHTVEKEKISPKEVWFIKESSCTQGKTIKTNYEVWFWMNFITGKNHESMFSKMVKNFYGNSGNENAQEHKLTEFCNDKETANYWLYRASACTQKDYCNIEKESGYWEEILSVFVILWLLWGLFLHPYAESIVLNRDKWTITLKQLSPLGYSVICDEKHAESFVNANLKVVRGKYKRAVSYYLRLDFRSSQYDFFSGDSQQTLTSHIDRINDFYKAYELSEKARGNFVKLKCECVICFSDAVDTMFLPCAHACCCSNCASELEICPLCRSVIKSKKKIFIEGMNPA